MGQPPLPQGEFTSPEDVKPNGVPKMPRVLGRRTLCSGRVFPTEHIRFDLKCISHLPSATRGGTVVAVQEAATPNRVAASFCCLSSEIS